MINLMMLNATIVFFQTSIVLAKMEYFRNWYCQVKRKEKTCKKYMPSSPATQHDQMALLNSK